MNFQDYLNIKALNASTIKACADSDQYGYDSINNLLTFSPASHAAMNLGSAAHTFLLEPHLFESEWCVSTKFDGRTTEGKNAKKSFEEANQGKKIISEDEFCLIKKFKSNCEKIPAVVNVFAEFEKEKTYQWVQDGVGMKARLDLVNEKDNVIIDLKSTKNASQKEFTVDIINMNYLLQLFHYALAITKEGQKFPNAYVIALETTSGEVALYNLTNMVYSDYTKNKYKKAIESYFRIKEMKERPTKYPKEIVSLELPSWIK